MTAPVPVAPSDQSVAFTSRCASCQSPLAADQLFCLSCGSRRRDGRIAFRDVLATEAAPVVAAPLSNGGGGWPPSGVVAVPVADQGPAGPGRITYVPFLATLGLLLGALGVGVWIGRDQQPVAAAPSAAVPAQIVAATTPAETTPTDDAAAADDAAKGDAKSSDDSSDAAADESSAPVKDDKAALGNLEKLSPQDYQKQSQKLPSEVGTGGKAPEADGKTGGGGTDFEDFQ
ncbi:MAG: hypothetical protein PGN13_06655 [Patulibacter minatonensis]